VCTLSKFYLFHACQLAWSFAALDHPSEELFCDGGPFLTCLAEQADAFADLHLVQLHQWQLWREECGARAVVTRGAAVTPREAAPAMLEALRARCQAAFVRCDAQAIASGEGTSGLQAEVESSLRGLGLEVESEVRTACGYTLDAVVTHGGRRVAVEVDGPSHFLGRKPSGGTLLKRRQLRSLEGWLLLSVPHWDWPRTAQRQAYLRRRLDALVGSPES